MEQTSAPDKQEKIDAIDRQWMNYDDGDLFVANDLRSVPCDLPDTVCTNKVVVITCYQGSLRLRLNNQTYDIQANDVAICYPEMTIEPLWHSDDMKCLVFGFSVQAMENTFYANERIWDTIFDTTKAPVIQLTEDDLNVLYHFAEITKTRIRRTRDPLQKRMMHSLLQAIIYVFFDIISRITDLPSPEISVCRKDQIFRQFIEMLGKENGRLRSVTEMANKLCITPKYLSAVVRQCSDKTPLEWIHQHMLNVIVQQLRYTDKSIKDIANDLGFPSQVFFGKFVKSKIGVSPRKYREQFHNQ